MNQQEFSLLAKKTLFYIFETIEDQDQECIYDIDFDGDIVTVKSPDGVFVINKHSAAQEIWLSSPISGPYHFSPTESSWQSSSDEDLYDILSTELNIKFSSKY